MDLGWVEIGARFVFSNRCYTIVRTDAQDIFWAQATGDPHEYRFLMWTYQLWQFLVIKSRYERVLEV